MSLKLNSPEQLAFYEELKQEGKLVDFYSENQQSIIESYGEDWLRELDEEYGPAYRNHLLMAHLIHWPAEQKNKLFELFPSLKGQFITGKHHPTILFFNLATQQILCVGLGRKNGSFYFDSETNEHVKSSYQEKMPTEYFEKLYKLDHHRFIADTLEYLDAFGSSHYEWSCFENEQDIRELLEKGPDEDGQFRFEGEDDDDDGHSKEELEEMLEEIDRLNMYMEDANNFFVRFFPDMEFYELSPGDFL
jgi:hypothetical protein